MLNRAGIDLQPQVDTIHLAAVELLRSEPDAGIIENGQRALQQVIEHAGQSRECAPIVANAGTIQQTFELIIGQQTSDPIRAGHNVIAMVADLGRTISAVDSGLDPSAYVSHTQSLFNAIPGAGDGNLIEIDLSDSSQLARLLQSIEAPASSPASVGTDLDAVRAKHAQFAKNAEMLLESAERPEIIDGLLTSLMELQAIAAAGGIEHIGRVVACALRVIESHRAAGEQLPLDAVEFIIACRRIIPMILESLNDPQRVSHAVDALVEQSAFVLRELRRGTRPLNDLWPEPDAEEYERIATGMLDPSMLQPPADTAAAGQSVTASPASAETSASEFPAFGDMQPGQTTQSLTEPGNMIRVPVERVDELIQLAGELTIRSGGYVQRSRKMLSVAQDINSIGDRLRYLIRGWQEGRYETEQARQHLAEITADLSLAAADLEHARNDHMAASERQAIVRERLETTITKLRSMPLKFLTDPLHEAVERVAEQLRRRVQFRVDGASSVIDVLHADALSEALRQLLINAVEHGIEPPEKREAAGKRPEGRLRIRATRDGSQTVIQVLDDGAGIDDEKILQAAKGAGYPVPPRGLTRDRILQYIFLPGFSTKRDADENLGMGLDEVSEAVSSASGTVTVHSELGRGTVFTLRVPLASMSMSGIVVAVSSQRLAIPAAEYEILELDDLGEITQANGHYQAELRGNALPAADLGALLSLRSGHHVQDTEGTYLRVYADDEEWILRVDRVLGQQSIELEPIGREHGHINGAVGSTTLPSGEQAVILDIAQVLDAGGRRSRRFSRQTASLMNVPFVLVSDDSISVRRHLASLMEESGWRVVEARDPFEARELLESVVPDLLVVDLDLPAYGGFQIIQAARNLANMPVIGLTSRDDDDIRRRAEASSIDGYLVKPLNYDDFPEFVNQIVHGPGQPA